MTLKDLCEQLKVILSGEYKFKEDKEFILNTLRFALYDIANLTAPVVLLTKDYTRYPILRQLDDVYFVREPELPQNLDDEILLDSSLELALLYKMASQIASIDKRGFYEQQYKVELDKFRFASFESLQRAERVETLHGDLL